MASMHSDCTTTRFQRSVNGERQEPGTRLKAEHYHHFDDDEDGWTVVISRRNG